MCESGGKYPIGLGGRGMRSVEDEYKMTKIKSTIKLHSNDDSTMSLVRALEAGEVISRSSKRLERL